MNLNFRAFACFLESTVYWLYLLYFSRLITEILKTPLLPSSSWDQTLISFFVTFIVDYIWRRFLAVGNCIDPGLLLIHYFKYQSVHLSNTLQVIISCVVSGVIVYSITEAVSPCVFATWNSSKGWLFCFWLEFLFDFMFHLNTCLHLLSTKCIVESLRQECGSTVKENAKSAQYELLVDSECQKIQIVGFSEMASFYTASIVAFGGYFSKGGPMINLTYTVMAALSRRDLALLSILGTANILAPLVAAKFVYYTDLKIPGFSISRDFNFRSEFRPLSSKFDGCPTDEDTAKAICDFQRFKYIFFKNDIFWLQSVLAAAKFLRLHSLIIFVKNFLLHPYRENNPCMAWQKSVYIQVGGPMASKAFRACQTAKLEIVPVEPVFRSADSFGNHQERIVASNIYKLGRMRSNLLEESLSDSRDRLIDRQNCINDDPLPPKPLNSPLQLQLPENLVFNDDLDF